MSDLIDRKAAINAIDDIRDFVREDGSWLIKEQLKKLPSAEAGKHLTEFQKITITDALRMYYINGSEFLGFVNAQDLKEAISEIYQWLKDSPTAEDSVGD